MGFQRQIGRPTGELGQRISILGAKLRPYIQVLWLGPTRENPGVDPGGAPGAPPWP